VEQLVARWAHIRQLTDTSSSLPAGRQVLSPLLSERRQLSPFFIIYIVYVVYSPPSDKIYIGYTSELKSRLKSHNELATKGWTIKFPSMGVDSHRRVCR